ncbi:MAG: putative DNA-binding domain-containing protein [Gammaproteobacteria bacterium]
MAERPHFQQLQYAFAAHIRNPDENPAPEGIEDRRLAIYRDLFFNNIKSLLSSSFPVLKKVLPEDRWIALIREFFSTHESRTPLFLEVPREFLGFLQNERGLQADDPPFLIELAHYEWVELALSIDDAEIEPDGIDPDGDLLDGIPVVSPLAWSLVYDFDVHHIGPNHQPAVAPDQPTFLVIYRDRTDKIGFIEINPVTARFLELAGAEQQNGREMLTTIAAELHHPKTDVVIEGGREILENLRRHDVVLGTRK